MISAEILSWQFCHFLFQLLNTDFLRITFYFGNDASMVKFIDGNQINLILSLSVPPIASLGESACLHHHVLEITFQSPSRETIITIGHIAPEQREKVSLNQRLVRIDESEPKAQEVVVNFVRCHLSILLCQQWLHAAYQVVSAFKVLQESTRVLLQDAVYLASFCLARI